MPPVTAFARAVELLAPGASLRELARRFRVSHVAISRWRRGLRKPPQAIADRIQSEIAEDARKRLEASQALRASPPHAELSSANIRAYNARRAKEKAALSDGQFPTDRSKP